jgi:protein-tyrosine-phosphatase
MHIHFVCSGNAYRSRLAEAYCRSKVTDKPIQFSSSGIVARKHKRANGPICWYAMRLMKRNLLISHMSWSERQTTLRMLAQVDLLVCMKLEHYEVCRDKFDYRGKYVVWDIPDLNEMPEFIPSTKSFDIDADINHIKLTEQTFQLIKQKADLLLKQII